MALADLIRARTREQVVARMLATLATEAGNSFGPTSYLPGGALRTLLELQGEAQADAERTVAALAAGGYLDTAAGEWLDAYVASQYDLQRQPADFASGLVSLTCLPLAGPYDLEAGTLIVGTLAGQRYTSTASVTVPAGGSVQVPVQAESPGSVYNVTAGSITVLHTPQPGLSVTNGTGWLTVAGSDPESDAQLRQRARLRWAERGGGATRGAYKFWALASNPAIDNVRVFDEHPRGQGTVNVVIHGQGGLGNDDVAVADAYIQARRPVTADVWVYKAIAVIQVLALELYAPGADHARIEGEVLVNLAALQRATPIGGTVYKSAIIEAAMLPAGMVDAKLPDYVQDLHLGEDQAFTFSPHLTWRA